MEERAAILMGPSCCHPVLAVERSSRDREKKGQAYPRGVLTKPRVCRTSLWQAAGVVDVVNYDMHNFVGKWCKPPAHFLLEQERLRVALKGHRRLHHNEMVDHVIQLQEPHMQQVLLVHIQHGADDLHSQGSAGCGVPLPLRRQVTGRPVLSQLPLGASLYSHAFMQHGWQLEGEGWMGGSFFLLELLLLAALLLAALLLAALRLAALRLRCCCCCLPFFCVSLEGAGRGQPFCPRTTGRPLAHPILRSSPPPHNLQPSLLSVVHRL